jgi:hypothetical protein
MPPLIIRNHTQALLTLSRSCRQGASSPARGAGVALASVTTDYNGTHQPHDLIQVEALKCWFRVLWWLSPGYTRASKPSVGFVEYGTQANSDGSNGSAASVVTSFFLAGARSVSSFLLA